LKNKNLLIILLVIILFLVCCLCLIVFTSGGLSYLYLMRSTDTPPSSSNYTTERTPSNNLSPQKTITPYGNNNFDPKTKEETSESASETLKILSEIYIPENDPRDLARRLQGIENIPDLVPVQQDYKVGDSNTFWVTNVDTNKNREIQAKLSFKTENVYFWIENGVDYKNSELEKLVTTFENKIIPTNREFFGTEWIPGIDEDPHLYILYATDLGSNLAGYFSSNDAVPPQIHRFSNAHEMFMLNADTIKLNEKFTYGVLAHEYQHMIHWYRDRNETSWLNEGFSELAAFLNGYYESGFDALFLANTDLQLNDWPNNPYNTTPHYGASFLFVNYFLNRFGEDATKALVQNSSNGLDSVDKVLEQENLKDPITGNQITADDLFTDWIIANTLQDKKAGDGRYYYKNYPSMPSVSITEKIKECEFGLKDRTVAQYGADIIELQCKKNFSLQFSGEFTTEIIPEFPYSGEFAYWSNKGDESHMVLSNTFNLTNSTGPIEMTYMTWYDLEADYDFLYLTASVDGENWQILDTPHCTTDNLSGNNYGCGYNGFSNGWISETVDLSQFAGEKVTIQFEYVTDAAVNGEGFLLDDVSIPAINYSSNFETGDGGWKSEGWARINNLLPQTYKVILLEFNSGKVQINTFELSEDQKVTIPINGKINNKTLLIVSGTTRYTRQPAYYQMAAQLSK